MNTTYFLGAGSSALALPTYIDFSKKIRAFISIFHSGSGFSKLSPEEKKISSEIYSLGIEYLSQEEFNTTPDRYARTMYSNKGNLKRLKTLLILFFAEQQISLVGYNGEPRKGRLLLDPRINELISKIIRPIPGKTILDPKYKILTWNYDFQFEMAYALHAGTNGFQSFSELQGFPNINFEKPSKQFDNDKFAIVHLNGVAYFKNGAIDLPLINKIEEEEYLMKFIIEYYNNIIRDYNPKIGGVESLKFAFEYFDEASGKPKGEPLDVAITIAQKTKDLVISGYSFPPFNREFDSIIFENFTSLENVIIKDLPEKRDNKLLKTVGNLLQGNFEKEEIEYDTDLDTLIT